MDKIIELNGTVEFPNTIKVLGRYSYAASRSGFLIVDVSSHDLLAEAAIPFRNFFDFEIKPLRVLD